MSTIDRLDISDIVQALPRFKLQQVAALSGDLGFPAYLVGGFVRDVLLGKPINDFDVVIEGGRGQSRARSCQAVWRACHYACAIQDCNLVSAGFP